MKIGSDIIKVYKDVHIWIGIVCGLLLFIAFYAGAVTKDTLVKAADAGK